MGLVLSEEDGRAIDLFLDQGVAQTTGGIAMHSPAVPPAKMVAVEKILGLLGQMPADEPPPNLLARTLQRIEKSEKGEKPEDRRDSQTVRRTPPTPPM
jgi:hypothetical protein